MMASRLRSSAKALPVSAALLFFATIAAAESSDSGDVLFSGVFGNAFSSVGIASRGLHLAKRAVFHVRGDAPEDTEAPFLVALIARAMAILATYKWPSWLLVLTVVVWVMGTLAAGLAGYALGSVMTTAVMAQSERPPQYISLGTVPTRTGPSAGLLGEEDEVVSKSQEDEINFEYSSRAAMSFATTHIRQFFREAREASGNSLLRTCARGAGWGVLYQVLLSILLNIADGTTTTSLPAPDAEMKASQGGDLSLPFTLPATTFSSLFSTFLAFLLATPLHTIWTFSILRLSTPSVSCWYTVRNLPYRALFLPASVAALGKTLFRMTAFLSARSFFLLIAQSFADSANQSQPELYAAMFREEDNPAMKIVWSSIGFGLIVAIAEIVLTIPTQMVLVRAEAAALVLMSSNEQAFLPLSPSEIESLGPVPFSGLRTLVPIDGPNSSPSPPASSSCATSRILTYVRSRLSWRGVRDSGILYVKRVFIQTGIAFSVTAFIAGTFAFVYDLKL